MTSHRVEVTVSLPSHLFTQMGNPVKQHLYRSRNDVIEVALERLLRTHLDARTKTEAAKLDHQAEIDEAEQGIDDFSSLAREK